MSRQIAFAGMLAVALATTLQATATTASGTVSINGKIFNLSGPADCLHTPSGSIYETPAAMWSVMMDGRGSSGVSRLNATIWLPTSGGAPQILFQAQTAGGAIDVATAVGGTIKGTATGRADRKGPGGTLVIEGRTASGQPVAMTMSCSGFVPPEDNG